MNIHAPRSRPGWPQGAAALLAAAVLGLGAGASVAAELPALIRDAVSADPAILEARANEDVAGTRLESTRAQHLPVLIAATAAIVAASRRRISCSRRVG